MGRALRTEVAHRTPPFGAQLRSCQQGVHAVQLQELYGAYTATATRSTMVVHPAGGQPTSMCRLCEHHVLEHAMTSHTQFCKVVKQCKDIAECTDQTLARQLVKLNASTNSSAIYGGSAGQAALVADLLRSYALYAREHITARYHRPKSASEIYNRPVTARDHRPITARYNRPVTARDINTPTASHLHLLSGVPTACRYASVLLGITASTQQLPLLCNLSDELDALVGAAAQPTTAAIWADIQAAGQRKLASLQHGTSWAVQIQETVVHMPTSNPLERGQAPCLHDFQMVREIQRGAHATVWLVTKRQTQDVFAMKVLTARPTAP